jgi:hypothetical protein
MAQVSKVNRADRYAPVDFFVVLTPAREWNAKHAEPDIDGSHAPAHLPQYFPRHPEYAAGHSEHAQERRARRSPAASPRLILRTTRMLSL